MKKGITSTPFGSYAGKPVYSYTITNAKGSKVSVINYGAAITGIYMHDRNGELGNVIIGFESMEGYLQNGRQYFGAVVGRYCNRIAGAAFILDDQEYRLALNEPGASLHGGITGFDKVWWDAEADNTNNRLILSYFSKDGEEGYPGNLHVGVEYVLTDDNELIIDYSARTDKTTHVNLTSHCYFNLSAGKEPTILDHELAIFADVHTNLFYDNTSSGRYSSVENTALDFNDTKRIGNHIDQLPDGYDHNMVLRSKEKAAELYDRSSGRFMEVFTTEPGLQFYSGNYLQNTVINEAGGKKLAKYGALCLEAQHHPNSPNEPLFPTTVLRPGDVYRQTTVYKFSVR